MRKIINDPQAIVDEVLEGIYHAHAQQLRPASADGRALVRTDAPKQDRVAIITGGGSGHLPLFLGYVGQGLCSGAAVGNVFSSPSVRQILDAARATEGGAGVLFLYGNYGGDVYNFDLAADVLRTEGVEVATVLGTDDILSAPAEKASTRRGVAGLILAYKVAGAATEQGKSLADVARIASKAVANCRTMGVGLAPTILPAAGEPTFELDEGEMEIGVGIHGERGVYRGAVESADAITDRFIAELETELTLSEGSRVAILVNGLGATPPEELYLIYRRLAQVLDARGVQIVQRYVGEYATSLEMAGASVSILELDDELEELILAPANSPFYQPGSSGSTQVDWPTQDDDASKSAQVARTGTPSRLREQLLKTLPKMSTHADELRRLDSEVGDGDLGITITLGSEAVVEAVKALPEDVSDRSLLLVAAQVFAEANPSTFAALTATSTMAAAETAAEQGQSEGRVLLEAFTNRLAERGGAQLGDKTMLDVLAPLQEAPKDASLSDLAARAQALLEESDAWQNRRGRASWQGERTKGQRDPGSAAVVHFLQELADSEDQG